MLLLGAVVLLPGCGASGGSGGTTATQTSPAAGIPTEAPAVTGTITSASDDSILVEENPQDQSGSAKILLRLSDDSRVLWASGATAGRADLTTGLKVRAWVTGPVATSYPLQGEAAVVVIDS